MHFHPVTARPNWKQVASELGYLSTIFDDPPYWVEALPQPFCGVFTEAEITNLIEPATRDIINLSSEVLNLICNGPNSNDYFDRLKIPVSSRSAIRISWNNNDKSIWGRLDFSYSDGKLKLLELNFDGAVSLYEAAVFQLLWFQQLQESGAIDKDAMQSNSIHDLLVQSFNDFSPEPGIIHFAAPGDDPEDLDTLKYLQSCAVSAKRKTKILKIKDLGYNEAGGLFDLDGMEIKELVKLYPWEWLQKEDAKISEKIGHSVLLPRIESGKTKFYEPIWKSLLANKSILAIFKEVAPDSPWLLDSAIEGTPESETLKQRPHVRKPLFGMQGSSISIVYPDEPEKSVTNPGVFGKSGFLIQELQPLPTYNNYHMLVGSWVIAGQPAGIGMRADLSPITTAKNCLFVPHYVTAN